MRIPSIRLNSGHDIPPLGVGLFKLEQDETQRIVEQALELGYRHLDGARIYGNEEAVGRAIRVSGIPREELFVTTKLWRDEQGRQAPLTAIDDALERLGLDYVDLYLIHWPHPSMGLALDTWLGLEEVAATGKARSIGVSNFRQEDLATIVEGSSTVPAVNQVELHPRFQQRALRAYQEPLGIRTEGWGPLGQGKYDLAELPALGEIAAAHGVSIQQVVLRWHLQEGVIVFPKSSRPERLRENLDVFGFELTAEELERIRGLDDGLRVGTDPATG
ncbi:MAG TPA: aldo/keto reductase [Microbacteriaceae bacterium]|nr:aldo/keto reductase [Microbacteriaceae bacterium]